MHAPRPTPSPPGRTTVRQWTLRLGTAIIFPALLLLGFEGALRVAGYGHSPHFLIADDQAGFLRTNPDFIGFHLPASFDLRPLNFRVPAVKPPRTLRVAVLGESAVQGIPAPAFGFVPQLRALLRARYPDREIEVINAGVVAINSHVVYQIAQDLGRCDPDVFVVYLGNNEVVGPYGPGCAYLADMWPVPLIRVSAWVRGTRTGQLVGAMMARWSARNGARREWGGMAMFADHAVRGDDPRLAAVERNFARNLNDIVRTARQAGARVVLATLVANLKDSPPFLSVHRPDISGDELAEWRMAFEAGRLAWKLEEDERTSAQLQRAYALDPHYADTAFMLGSLALRRGDAGTARKLLFEAMHWDALRFRPAPRLNEIIRETAAANPGITLVDAARALGADPGSTGGICGRELMLEHVHPDWDGNYQLARLLADGVEQVLGAPASAPAWLDAPGVAAAIGYTPVERLGVLQHTAQITREAPFSNQLTYAEDQARLARAMAEQEKVRRDPVNLGGALATVRLAITHDPQNAELAKLAGDLADDLGDTAESLAEVRRARTLQPANFALATDESIKLARLGRYDEAERLLFATAAGCRPQELAKMIPAVADFFTRTKRWNDGRAWFDRALAREPRSVPLRYYRGRLSQLAGDARAAESDYRDALAADPTAEYPLEQLIALLQAEGKAAEAGTVALDHAPLQRRNQANHLRVAEWLEASDRRADAAAALDHAIHTGPTPMAIHLRLANLRYGLNERDAALDELATAWRIAREENDRDVSASIGELIRRIRTPP